MQPNPPYLAAMYIARNIEDALLAPAETGELHLAGQGLGAFPLEALQLPRLRLLDLGNNLLTTLPAEIGGLAQLEVLVLRGNAIRELPPEIGQLQRLQRLDLEKNQLAALPGELQHCDGLRELRLGFNVFEEWPAPALTPRLESLSIQRNQLREIPVGLRHLTRLHYLDLSYNRLQQLPTSLLLIEALQHLFLEGNPLAWVLPSAHPEGDWELMVKELRRNKAPIQDRIRWFRLLQSDTDLCHEEAPHLLAAALDSPLAAVRAAAKLLLPQWFPSPLPATGPAEICIGGTIASKSMVVKAFQSAGFHVLPRPNSATIVILGERPGAMAAQAFADGNPIGYEGHLAAWIKAAQGEFLSASTTAHPMTANLRRLIRSYRKENIEMAFVIMAKAGIPPELLTEMLAIKLFHSDLEVRAQAAEAFSQLADRQLQAFVARQVDQHYKAELVEKVPELVEALLRNKAIVAATLVDAAIDLAQGHLGLVLLLPEAERLPHFQKFLQEGQLNLSNLRIGTFPTALAQLHDLRFLMLSRNQLRELPHDLQAFSKIEMLDLADNHLTTLPPELGALQQLKGLDLSHNRLRALPDSIGTLPSLEALRLDRNPLTALPATLTQLPHLEMLSLYGCKFAQFPSVVWELTSLKSLELGECNLRVLPSLLEGFAELESLGLRENPLTELPAWLGELKALRYLDLSLMPVRQLPASLHGHPRIERMYLIRDESMDWEQVIPILASMPRLRYVYLRGKKIVRNIQLLIEDQLPRVRVYWNG